MDKEQIKREELEAGLKALIAEAEELATQIVESETGAYLQRLEQQRKIVTEADSAPIIQESDAFRHLRYSYLTTKTWLERERLDLKERGLLKRLELSRDDLSTLKNKLLETVADICHKCSWFCKVQLESEAFCAVDISRPNTIFGVLLYLNLFPLGGLFGFTSVIHTEFMDSTHDDDNDDDLTRDAILRDAIVQQIFSGTEQTLWLFMDQLEHPKKSSLLEMIERAFPDSIADHLRGVKQPALNIPKPIRPDTLQNNNSEEASGFRKPDKPKRPGPNAERDEWFAYKYACYLQGIKVTHKVLAKELNLVPGTVRNYYCKWLAEHHDT